MRSRPPGISGGLCEVFYDPKHSRVSLSGSIVPDVQKRVSRYARCKCFHYLPIGVSHSSGPRRDPLRQWTLKIYEITKLNAMKMLQLAQVAEKEYLKLAT
jgi:hypothetical protein